jgi:hypothetical protein
LTIPSGLITYTIPLTPADAEVGGSLYPTSLGSRSAWTTKANPYTGKKIEGWKFDSRIWPDDLVENINSFVPGIFDPTHSGVTRTYFQSGIGDGDDCRLEELRYIVSSGIQASATSNLWAPIINHGYFYDYNEGNYLFSDDSITLIPSYSGVVAGVKTIPTGYSRIELPEFPKVGTPMLARTFAWDAADSKYDISVEYRKKVDFTGKRLSDGTHLPTYSGSTRMIIWPNIEPSDPEFIVTYSGFTNSGVIPSAIFNRQVVSPVGTITASGVPTFSALDTVGYAEEEGQQYHLTYAPVDKSSPVRVFSWSESGSGGISAYREWQPVPSGTSFVGNQVLLDADLGTIQFGTVASGQNFPPIGSKIGAHYYKSVQFEYEPEYTQDSVVALEANLNPMYRRSGRGFVYISPYVSDPATVVLTAELPLLSLDKYGPLYIGSNFCPVVATVKDSKGNVLEGIAVDIEITSVPTAGTFGSSNHEVTAVTDEYGEARCFYNPPRTIAEIGEEIDAAHMYVDAAPAYADFPYVTQTTVMMTSNILLESSDSPDDIYVYGVYTDDPILGVQYGTVSATDIAAQAAEYYKRYFSAEDIYGETGMIPSGVVSTAAINWEDGHRMIWNLARPTIFESNAGLGRRMILTEYDATALNPHTIADGAWVPKQPFKIELNDTVGSYSVVFDTTRVAIPLPTGSLNSYFLVAPTSVKLKAHVYNPRLNRTIYSNEIEVKLSIPDYMNGLWLVDGVNSMNIGEISSFITAALEGKKLPLGFRLRSSSVTLAAALDGITFLDVNSTDNPTTTPSTWPTLGMTFTVT